MRVGSFFDIDIHISMWLVVMVAAAFLLGNGAEIATIFLIIFIHETSHVLTARALNLKVREIELLPFGGAVRIESIFELNPKNEILIAAAGPLSNIFLVICSIVAEEYGLIESGSFDFFNKANLMLMGFNLLPALPLDGGRMLRAILSRSIGMKKATQVTAGGGVILSLFLVVTGVYAIPDAGVNPTIFIAAAFLAYSALKEKRVATYIFLRDITYKKDTLIKEGSMLIREMAVMYDQSIKNVMKKFTPHRYHYVQVVDEQLRVKGWVSESQIIKGLIDYGLNVPIIRLVKDNQRN
jgi:stage IV sporulation protein FB